MDFSELDIKKEYIIIGFRELKPFILSKKSANPRLNFKFFSLQDLQEQVYGTTELEAIKSSLPYLDDDFSLTQKFISYIRKGVNPEIDETLKSLKKHLDDNNLLSFDENFAQIFKDKEVLIIGYLKDNVELNHVLKNLNVTNPKYIGLDEFIPKKDFDVIKFSRNDEAIRYTFIKINDLLKQGVSPNDIEILTDIKTNYFYLRLFGEESGLVLNLKEYKTLYDTTIAKKLEKKLDFLTSENIIDEDDDSDYFKDIKNILDYFDFYNLKHKASNFKNILSMYSINTKLDTESIKVTNRLDYVVGKYVFLLGFDTNFYSQILKNKDYFDDEVKEKYNLNSSKIANLEGDILYEHFLYRDDLLNIYYYESDSSKREISYYLAKRYPKVFNEDGDLIDDPAPKHIKKPEILKVDYSKTLAKVYYSYYLNLKDKFFIKSPYYDFYHNYFGDLEQYSSDYTKIEREERKNFYIAYSPMNEFYECPFKYYCSRILKLDSFETSFYLESGNFIHKIMEHVYDKDADFDKFYDEIFKEYEDKFSNLDLRFLTKIKKTAKYVFNRLHADFFDETRPEIKKENYHETDLTVYRNNQIINGKIDSILLATKGEGPNIKKGIQLIDYKTGSVSIDLKEIIYGMNLQLPVYTYLTHHSKQFAGIPISGIYYQNFAIGNYFNFYNGDLEDVKDYYKKSGLTEPDMDLFNLFDQINIGDSSSRIASCRMTKSGDLKGKSFKHIDFDEKIIDENNEEFLSIIEQFFDFYEQTCRENDFKISPYKHNEYDACKYCKFHDICFDNDKLVRKQEPLFKLKGVKYKDDKEASDEEE